MNKKTEHIERYTYYPNAGLREHSIGDLYKVSDVDPIITSLLEQIKEQKQNIENMLNNKWSQIEIDIAEAEAQRLWQKLNGVERIDDLLHERNSLLEQIKQKDEEIREL